MRRRILALIVGALACTCALAGSAAAFTVSGRFLYEDRKWDKNGYTGAVQNLPIRHAKVEVINLVGSLTLASGATDADGFYSLNVTGQTLPTSFYVRCSADGTPAGYFVKVLDNFVRVPTVGLVTVGATNYAIVTDTTLANPVANNVNKGTYLIKDLDGNGVAQAFNILDCGMDMLEWLASAQVNGALPTAAQSLTYAWKPLTGPPGNAGGGSNYSLQGVYIGADTTDTDGWSDTVIMHETGHWYDDLFSRTNNPGGAHFLGDNNANVLLAYGEGSATFHCAKGREYRAFHRTNLLGQPIDAHVSVYSDLMIPPPVGTPGGLSFAYDFENGTFNDGTPIGQRGTANETNVTTALWDIVDGPETPDDSPGVDDEPLDVSDSYAWAIEHSYLTTLTAHITVEDYYQGWFALNGPTFQKTAIDSAFIGLARMPYHADTAEPDNALGTARPITPVAHGAAVGHMVISELDLGVQDAVELYNASPAPVDITGWQLQVYVNDDTQQQVARIYTFLPLTVQPGDAVALYERGDETLNGQYHLYAGDTVPVAWNASWNAGLDGAVVLRNNLGNAVDFVKWRDAQGNDNNTPVPAGTAFTGVLVAPPTNELHLARDVNGTDTDAASDWTYQSSTLASVNDLVSETRTIFGTGDADLFKFVATAGTRYGFEAHGPYSATDPKIELLSSTGVVLGSSDNADPGVRDARFDFFAGNSDTYYLRVSHVGADTDWGEYDLIALQHPPSSSLQAPTGVSANAAHSSDTSDPVSIQWLNSSVYDSVKVFRDSAQVAVLAGNASSFSENVPRGLYRYEVSGKRGTTETARTSNFEFAGLVTCHAEDDFESGAAAYWVTDGSTWGTTPIAAGGTFGFTDSPAGTYLGCPTGASGCHREAIAMFGVPALLPSGSSLEFDQICCTEDNFDFGIVEVSGDDGGTWTELARYDQGDDPGWADGVGDPTDYRHTSLDLAAFANQTVLVRFRLESDSNLEFDGWYLDNVHVNDANCTPVVSVLPGSGPSQLRFARTSANPGRGAMRFAFALPRSEEKVDVVVYDVSGRELRHDRLGAKAAGEYSWTWTGRDDEGHAVASGVYFARLVAGARTITQKSIWLAE
jgi:hypothetical protein